MSTLFPVLGTKSQRLEAAAARWSKKGDDHLANVGVTLSNQGSQLYLGGLVSADSNTTGSQLLGGAASTPGMQALRTRVVGVARTQLGVREVGNNAGAQVEAYLAAAGGHKGDAWCAAFVYWCFKTASDQGQVPNPLQTLKHALSVTEIYSWAQRNKFLYFNPAEAQPGDIILFMRPERKDRHTGLVIEGSSSGIQTIEGNSSNGVNPRSYDLKQLAARNAVFVNAIGGHDPVRGMMQAGNLLGGSVNQGQYSELIKKYSKALGVDPSLVSAMIEAESSQRQYNKDGSIYTSSAGAAGMAQIMPGTAEGIVQNYQKDLQKVLGMRVTKQLVLNDPNANLAAGILHLGVLIQTVKNAYPHIGLEEQYKLALAAYNAGYGAVKKYKGVPPYKQTQDYVAKILKNYRILKGR